MNKQDITEFCINKISEGNHFTIDFETRSLKMGKEILIENGQVKDGYELFNFGFNDEDRLDVLDKLYLNFKYSRPSEHEYGHYFKALDATELSDEELMDGTNREKARFWLEYYVLSEMILGWKWSDITREKDWFYESTKADGLVLLKDWFTEKEAA